MSKNVNRLIFVLSILGLIISAFLAYEYLQPASVVCPITGSGCETVRNSQYSSILGISIPHLGILYYLITAISSIYLIHNYHKMLDKFRFLINILALVFGIYLTYLEAFIIKAYCFWCVSSFIISILITVLSWKSILSKDEN
ncbi:MAG: vitamin K epoxide reductase family protein [Candidatus Levyibacteriota bacterium]|nr:MAG: vitamin K epoxide reductase family protein [Candidatus Levybacteria bacterium]